MPAFSPTPAEKENLHRFYVSMRLLSSNNVVPTWSIQRSFEEMMNGYMAEYIWQPTHISVEAVKLVAEGQKRKLQRAHGVIEGKFDRYKRTMGLMQGPEMTFEEWLKFYIEHDASVLVTREEHNSNKKFLSDELIELPPRPHSLFVRAGFTFAVRKTVEIVWAQAKLKELGRI